MSSAKQHRDCLERLRRRKITALALGASAGGVEALCELVPVFGRVPFPLMAVLHLPPDARSVLPEVLGRTARLRVKEAEPWEPLEAGTLYLAPPDYHLSVEADRSLSLSTEEPVHYSRPSIDVLLESAAGVFREGLLGVLLTGANADGAAGLASIQRHGGFTLAEEPSTAKSPEMPRSALRLIEPDCVLPLSEMKALFAALWGGQPAEQRREA